MHYGQSVVASVSPRLITISGRIGDDAKPYQIKAVRQALKDIAK